MTTPTQQLAERIVQRLVTEHLLTPGDAARLQAKLIDGKLRPDDWRQALEHAVRPAARGAEHAP